MKNCGATMLIEYKREFVKRLNKLPPAIQERVREFAFVELPEFDSLGESGKIEKLQGYPDCFKVRFGDYRVCLVANGEKVTIHTVRHRGEVYRYFP